MTLSRNAGHLPSPIHALKTGKPLAHSNPSNSKISNKASTSSLKSDKSDSQIHSLNRDRSHTGNNTSTLKSHGGLRDIFRVRLARKKLSSPEVEILQTLDSAIASGGGGSSTSSAQRKARRKRGSRNSGNETNSIKNGTWPRTMLNRNSACSYTLQHNAEDSSSTGAQHSSPSEANRGGPENHYASLNPPYRKKSDSSGFYSGGQYIPNMSSSSTVGARRNAGAAKDRVSLSSLPWDVAMRIPGGGNMNTQGINPGDCQLQLLKNNLDTIEKRGKGESDKSTLNRIRPGFVDSVNAHDIGGGLVLRQGQPERTHSAQPPHHRYSFGVFDPSNMKSAKS